jgi:hypothetical protein
MWRTCPEHHPAPLRCGYRRDAAAAAAAAWWRAAAAAAAPTRPAPPPLLLAPPERPPRRGAPVVRWPLPAPTLGPPLGVAIAIATLGILPPRRLFSGSIAATSLIHGAPSGSRPVRARWWCCRWGSGRSRLDLFNAAEQRWCTGSAEDAQPEPCTQRRAGHVRLLLSRCCRAILGLVAVLAAGGTRRGGHHNACWSRNCVVACFLRPARRDAAARSLESEVWSYKVRVVSVPVK